MGADSYQDIPYFNSRYSLRDLRKVQKSGAFDRLFFWLSDPFFPKLLILDFG